MVYFIWCVPNRFLRSKHHAYYYLSRVGFYFYTDQARVMYDTLSIYNKYVYSCCGSNYLFIRGTAKGKIGASSVFSRTCLSNSTRLAFLLMRKVYLSKEAKRNTASNRIRTDDLHITSVAPYQLGHRSCRQKNVN